MQNMTLRNHQHYNLGELAFVLPATEENTVVLPVLKCWQGCLTNDMGIQYKYEVLFACLALEPWAMFSGFSLQLWEKENYFILEKKQQQKTPFDIVL